MTNTTNPIAIIGQTTAIASAGNTCPTQGTAVAGPPKFDSWEVYDGTGTLVAHNYSGGGGIVGAGYNVGINTAASLISITLPAGLPATGGWTARIIDADAQGDLTCYSCTFDVALVAPTADEHHFFSTGVLSATYYDPVAQAQATTPFGEVQGIDLMMDWSAVDLETAAQTSLFPVDVAFHGGKFTAKCQHVGITADQLSFLAGLSLATNTGVAVETISAVSFPEQASLTFTGRDTKGRTIVVTFNRVVSKGWSIPFKLADWAMADTELHCIKDSAGLIGTIAVTQ